MRAFCDEQHTRREGAGRLEVVDAYLVSSARGDHHPQTQPLINVSGAGGESRPSLHTYSNSVIPSRFKLVVQPQLLATDNSQTLQEERRREPAS